SRPLARGPARRVAHFPRRRSQVDRSGRARPMAREVPARVRRCGSSPRRRHREMARVRIAERAARSEQLRERAGITRPVPALADALNELDRRGRAAATGGWPEVQARLADAHPTTDQYLAAYRRIWDDCRASADRANLVTWPDYPIRYVPMPVHTRDAAPLLY